MISYSCLWYNYNISCIITSAFTQYVCVCVLYVCVRVYVSGLKLGRVIRDMFCPGWADVTHFIKYLGLIQILYWITCIDNGVFSWSKCAWRRWNYISWFSWRYFERVIVDECILQKKTTKGSRAGNNLEWSRIWSFKWCWDIWSSLLLYMKVCICCKKKVSGE